MELRSSARQRENVEFKELQITLRGLGFYEEGMNLQEMRQIVEALQQSVSQNETSFQDCDIERATRESELDFMPMSEYVHNSTMIDAYNNLVVTECASSVNIGSPIGFRRTSCSSPFSSPEIPSVQLTVQAQVHHSLDWSPTSMSTHTDTIPDVAPLPTEGEHSSAAIAIKTTTSADAISGAVKRSHLSDYSTSTFDSGVSLSEGAASAASSSLVSSAEASSDSNSVSADNLTWDNRAQASSSSVAMSGNNSSFDAPDVDSSSEPTY